MTSTLVRPPSVATDSHPEALAPPAAALPLAELRAAMASPGVIPAEVDALLAAIDQPPGGDEAPRDRADFLLSLITMPGEAGLQTGSAGITVRTAAVEALLELGYPYALEVPPDALERARQERGRRGRKKEARASDVNAPTSAIVVTVITVLLQLLMLSLLGIVSLRTSSFVALPALLAASAPPVLAILGARKKSSSLQRFGALGMGLQGLIWLVATVLVTGLDERPLLWLVFPWYMPLLSAYLMHPKAERPPPDTAP